MPDNAVKKRGSSSIWGAAGKKAQITLFIIIALILIAGALSYIYLTREKVNIDPIDKARQDAETLARSDSIRVYVGSCLETATKDAVLLVGRQGGYLYDTQYNGGIFLLGPGGEICGSFPPGTCDAGANVIPYETRAGETDMVSFLIKQNPNLAFPLYPYRGYLRTKDQPDTFGVVVGGESKGSPVELCDADGPNARDTEGAKHTCFNSYSMIGKSIQNFLESYISQKVQECADFSNVEVTQGAKIEAENASAEVMFGDTDLITTIHYRLKIIFSTKQSVTTIADYSYHLSGMRLKELYELAYYLVKEDTTNIFFDKTSESDLNSLSNCMDPSSEARKTSCLREGMSVTRIENPCAGCPQSRYADIIQLRDTHSSIEGEPYIFQFAVANRPPALDMISISIPETTHYYRYLSLLGKVNPLVYKKRSLENGDEDKYDIIVSLNDQLGIYPYGADPDEDTLTYRYVPLGSDTVTSEKLEASADFLVTKRDAALDAGTLGVGEYSVRLTVADDEGFTDWQDLSILVCDDYHDCVFCSDCEECPDPPLPQPDDCERCEDCPRNSPQEYCCT